MSEIIIDEEFANLLPALTSEEFEKLENSIIQHGGAIHPLIVWEEEGIVIDGHNRLKLCEKHDLPYPVKKLSFKSRLDVIDWIAHFQFSRRNMGPQQQERFVAKLLNMRKKSVGGDGTNQHTKEECTQNGHIPQSGKTPEKKRTIEKIAEETGVSKNTVARAAKKDAILNKVGEHSPELEKSILNSPKKIPAKVVEELASDQELAARVQEKVKAGVEVVQAVKDVKAEAEPDGDGDDEPIADKMPDHIRSIFNVRPAIRQVIAAVRDAKKALHELAKKHPEACVFMHLDHAERQLHEVKSHINLCQPFNLCPYCRGAKAKQDTCQGCKGNGWVPKTIFTNAPRELREVIK